MNEDLRARLAKIDGVRASDSEQRHDAALDSPQVYAVDGVPILRFESETVVVIRLTGDGIRQRRALLRSDDRVRLRGNGADWLSVQIREPEDADLVLELAAAAADAARAGD